MKDMQGLVLIKKKLSGMYVTNNVFIRFVEYFSLKVEKYKIEISINAYKCIYLCIVLETENIFKDLRI